MVIGVSGKARSGKGVFASVAVKEFGAIELSFAGLLKKEVADFLTAHHVSWEERHLYGENVDKEEILVIDGDLVFAVDDKIWSFFETYCVDRNLPGFRFTPRSLMQWWGTEYRRAQDTEYWVKKCLAQCESEDKIYVISDCRFKNEAIGVLYHGGYLVRIERPSRPRISNENHPSEIDLDDWGKWDLKIYNVGDLDDMEAECERSIRSLIVHGRK